MLQLLSCIQFFADTTDRSRPSSPSITSSQGLLKLMFTEPAMPSKHLILCRPLLLLPSIFPSIRVFSDEKATVSFQDALACVVIDSFHLAPDIPGFKTESPLDMRHCMQVLSSPTRDRTHAPCGGSTELQLLDCQGVPQLSILIKMYKPK